MRLLLIRHGDPDYVHDSLTEKGRREAGLLAEQAPSMDLGDVYVSTMGRAQETASYSLKAAGKTAAARSVDWIMEFITDLNLNEHPEFVEAYGADTPKMEYYGGKAGLYGRHKSDLASAAHLEECSDYVFSHFDSMLAEHGYRRDGLIYRVEKANTNTVTCFCHLGLTCLLVSHLTNQSPFAIWEHFAFAPTSVSEFVTEEREKGIAIFRGLRLGDISHLTVGGEKPSFSARFCEIYDNMDQRH